MMIVDPSEAGEQVRAGKLRVIAQVNERRLPGFPDMPTIKEAGFDIPNVPQMRGVVGAPGMSAETVAFYEDLFLKVSKTAGWQKFVDDSQLDGEFVKAAELKAFLVQVRGRAARDPEGGRRQGGAVGPISIFLRRGHSLSRCRPREGGDPYAVSARCDDALEVSSETLAIMGPRLRGDDTVHVQRPCRHSAARFCTKAAAALS